MYSFFGGLQCPHGSFTSSKRATPYSFLKVLHGDWVSMDVLTLDGDWLSVDGLLALDGDWLSMDFRSLALDGVLGEWMAEVWLQVDGLLLLNWCSGVCLPCCTFPG